VWCKRRSTCLTCWFVVTLQRQEQLERSLHQIGALNEKLTKERREQKEEIETAMKKIKNLQQHREKAKELSNQVESNKEELTRLRKTEAELTKLNAKLKAEAESLAGTSDTRVHSAFRSHSC
jgi:DNA repair exonuclease SbcCD ATPase subunit